MRQHNYITLNELMASVESDLDSYAANGMIDRGKVIKTVRAINESLGLKINKEKQEVLEISNYKVDLPADFLVLQVAFLLGSVTTRYHQPGEILGTHTTEYNSKAEVPVEILDRSGPCMVNKCGEQYWVTQKFEDRYVDYKQMVPLRVKTTHRKLLAPGILNNTAKMEIQLEDGYIVCPIESGHLFINYIADMVDEEGNVLILDHPLLTDYYEYSVQKKLLEGWLLNTDADVAQKLIYVKNELREARIRANNFIRTNEFSEITETFNARRKAFYNKYFRIFE